MKPSFPRPRNDDSKNSDGDGDGDDDDYDGYDSRRCVGRQAECRASTTALAAADGEARYLVAAFIPVSCATPARLPDSRNRYGPERVDAARYRPERIATISARE